MPKVNPCPHCGASFTPNRLNQRFCSANCRKGSHQKKDRAKNPKNSAHSPTTRYDNALLFDRAMRMSEELYLNSPSERLGYVKDLVDEARSGNSQVRRILTNKFLLFAGADERHLFFRRSRSYPNITQAANRYCWKFWRVGVVTVVRDMVSEPETGEIFDVVALPDEAICDDQRQSVVSIFYIGDFLRACMRLPEAPKAHPSDTYLRLISEVPDKLVA